MTSRPHPHPFFYSPEERISLKLEFIPIREQDGPRFVPRRRGSLRLYWILRDSSKAALSGGYTLGASPI